MLFVSEYMIYQKDICSEPFRSQLLARLLLLLLLINSRGTTIIDPFAVAFEAGPFMENISGGRVAPYYRYPSCAHCIGGCKRKSLANKREMVNKAFNI